MSLMSRHDDGIFNLYRLGRSFGPSRARAIRACDSVRPSRRARLDRRWRDTRRRAGRRGTHTHSRALSSVAPSHRRRRVSRSIASIVDRSMKACHRCTSSMTSDDIDRSIELEIAIEIRDSAIRCVFSCVWVNSQTDTRDRAIQHIDSSISIVDIDRRKSTSTRRRGCWMTRGCGCGCGARRPRVSRRVSRRRARGDEDEDDGRRRRVGVSKFGEKSAVHG